jgi:NMT1-like family
MTKGLRIGYVPLTELHVAKTQHFAAARGVEIELVADSSWATIRDKLVAGHFDAAHMLKARTLSATARKRSWHSGPNGRGRMGTRSAPSREPSATRRAGRRRRATGTPW